MIIDEDQLYPFTRYTKVKGKAVAKYSDHHTIIINLNVSWKEETKSNREEMFNLRNKEHKCFF